MHNKIGKHTRKIQDSPPHTLDTFKRMSKFLTLNNNVNTEEANPRVVQNQPKYMCFYYQKYRCIMVFQIKQGFSDQSKEIQNTPHNQKSTDPPTIPRIFIQYLWVHF